MITTRTFLEAKLVSTKHCRSCLSFAFNLRLYTLIYERMNKFKNEMNENETSNVH